VAIDLEAAFAAVEAQGGRALRDEWSRVNPAWSATADVGIDGPVASVRIRYGGPERQSATFIYDVTTGQVERAQ
jgi:hypothetical protein